MFPRGMDLENREVEKTGESWYVFAPEKGSENGRKKRTALFRALALVFVLIFFISAHFYPVRANTIGLIRKIPGCRVYPIIYERDFTGVITFPEPEYVVGAKYAVWENTLERKLFEEEIPKEIIDTGSYTIPTMSFWDDYMEHRSEYAGFEAKGNYKQVIWVTLYYETGTGEIKSRSFTADTVEAPLCWMQQATRKNGRVLMSDGYVTEIVHTMHLDSDVRECLIEQPGKVMRSDIISVRVLIDGQEPAEKPIAEKPARGLFVIRIPIPEGHKKDGSHTVEIYTTQYITGFKKSVEFMSTDTY